MVITKKVFLFLSLLSVLAPSLVLAAPPSGSRYVDGINYLEEDKDAKCAKAADPQACRDNKDRAKAARDVATQLVSVRELGNLVLDRITKCEENKDIHPALCDVSSLTFLVGSVGVTAGFLGFLTSMPPFYKFSSIDDILLSVRKYGIPATAFKNGKVPALAEYLGKKINPKYFYILKTEAYTTDAALRLLSKAEFRLYGGIAAFVVGGVLIGSAFVLDAVKVEVAVEDPTLPELEASLKKSDSDLENAVKFFDGLAKSEGY